MISSLAWFAEFALECSGSLLAYRRRLWTLLSLLAFRALADIVTFSLWHSHFGKAYGYAWWSCQIIQYLLLCALAIQVIARMLVEHRELFPYVYGLVLITTGFAFHAFWVSGLKLEKFLNAEIAASCCLSAAILVGWMSRKAELQGRWKWIAGGIVISCAGNAACAAVWKVWSDGWRLYPLPAIAALLLWNWAGIAKEKIGEYRMPLGQKLPQSVSFEEKERWVM